MASVCASVLSMMDAGVPIKTPIAGIAMGLIKEEDDVAILTDIVGMEDHLGDMDFKVAGSRDGVTALQMDMKVKGIDLEILTRALDQARDARLQIMDVMTECIAAPREQMSPHAPRILRIDVPQDKIGQLIGPGGRNIRALQDDTGAEISVEDDGAVFITAVDQKSGEAAFERISAMTRDIEPGQIYTGKVVRILPFGAFVEMVPGKDALVHISELADYRVDKVEDVVSVGDEMQIIVIEVDNLGRVNASRKALLNGDTDAPSREPRESRDRRSRDDRPPRREREAREPREPREPRQRRQRVPREARPQVDDEPAQPEQPEPVEAEVEAPVAEVTEAPAATEPAPASLAATPGDEDSAAVAPPREGQPRRRRRRRRRGSAQQQGGDSNQQSGDGSNQQPSGQRNEQPAPRDSDEQDERQPDSNVAPRRRGGILSRVNIRRSPQTEGDGPPPPPPPPRSDFGAPSR